MGLFSLERRRGDLIILYKHLRKGNKDEGARPFSAASSVRIKGNRQKLKHIRFHLNTRKHHFIVRVVKYWSRLANEVVESPSVEIRKA